MVQCINFECGDIGGNHISECVPWAFGLVAPLELFKADRVREAPLSADTARGCRSATLALSYGCGKSLGAACPTHIFWSSGHGNLAKPAKAARSPEGTREISWNQGSKLSNATIVPHGDVVADLRISYCDTRKCSGNCHAHGHQCPTGAQESLKVEFGPVYLTDMGARTRI